MEEEGAVEGIQEWQQPQGLPARGGQLAPLQLVQQVSFKYCTVYAVLYMQYIPPLAKQHIWHRCELVSVVYLTNRKHPDLDQGVFWV